MLDTNRQNTKLTPELIVKRFLYTESVTTHRKNMRTLMDSYFLNEDDLTADARYNIYSTFLAVEEALAAIQEYDERGGE